MRLSVKNKRIAVLGSTGSIGTQTLMCAKQLGYGVSLLTASKNISLLEAQIREFSPEVAAVTDEAAAETLRLRVSDTGTRVFSGSDGIIEALDNTAYDIAVNGIVGVAGMLPTLRCAEKGRTVALANKESLVVAGDIIMKTAKEKKAKIITVDSEHSAVFQCLNGIVPTASDLSGGVLSRKLSKIILTASGGAFWGMKKDELKSVTADAALKHPNWKMGSKITIDCATMMNKGFEVIEAMQLFGVPGECVDILIHRESIIHSMVELCDGAVLAQLSVPDMRLAIQYALTYPERKESGINRLDLASVGKLTFFKPDYEAFPAPLICRQAKKTGGTATAVLNAANEEAVSLFLRGAITFPQITEFAERALSEADIKTSPSIEEIIAADIKTRETVKKYV